MQNMKLFIYFAHTDQIDLQNGYNEKFQKNKSGRQ